MPQMPVLVTPDQGDLGTSFLYSFLNSRGSSFFSPLIDGDRRRNGRTAGKLPLPGPPKGRVSDMS